ncbi:hypothetical protein CDAR_111261 [Caerostris darwini]|uniref:Uncharacterized protein n=1 Tax=Caerostris darwini TaxID=1538125 RepID=A0AAV4SCR0_9ARAC|nr:hypothetical protein CDAR_111261 [Caerostris darwini]
MEDPSSSRLVSRFTATSLQSSVIEGKIWQREEIGCFDVSRCGQHSRKTGAVVCKSGVAPSLDMLVSPTHKILCNILNCYRYK